ncbi:MAG: hypothetical protein WCP16_21620 [Pseudanabaena sp. ELA645]
MSKQKKGALYFINAPYKIGDRTEKVFLGFHYEQNAASLHNASQLFVFASGRILKGLANRSSG